MAEADGAEFYIRRLTDEDRDDWLSMRQALWMGTDTTTQAAKAGTLLTDPEKFGVIVYDVLVAVIGERAIGFAELSLRDDLETFGKRLVAYVEGVFVEPDWRGQGVGLALLEAAGHWARVKSVQELVSDVLADNDVSVAFHQRAGFWRVGETLASGKRQVLLARRVGDQ